MPRGPKSSRREFLKLATATTLAASSRVNLLDAQEAAPVAPGERLGLATIGLGGQGTGDTKAALKAPGVELNLAKIELARSTTAGWPGPRRPSATRSPPRASTRRSSPAPTWTR